MGEWETYCAICGAPTNSYVRIAEKPLPAHLRRLVDEAISKRRAQTTAAEDEKFELEVENQEELTAFVEDDANSWSYDPDIVSREDTLWLHTILAVALHDYECDMYKRLECLIPAPITC